MERNRYLNILEQLNHSIAEHELVFDGKNNLVDYRYVYVNQHFCDELDIRREDILFKNVYEVFENLEIKWLHIYYDVVKSGEPREFVEFSSTFNKTFHIYCFKSGEQKFVSVFNEVKDLNHQERDLEKDRMLLRTFSESSKAAFFEFDVREGLFDYSKTLEDIIGVRGITLRDYLDKFIAIVHPDDKMKVFRLNSSIMKNQLSEKTIELRIMHQEMNKYIWISFFVYVSERLKYLPIKVRGIVRDITKEKEMEIDLKESSELFEETKKIANMASFLFYSETEVFEENLELEEFLGIKNLYRLDQFREIVHPDDLERFDAVTNVLKVQKSATNTYRIYKDNEVRYINSYLYAIKDDNGVTNKISGVLRDVTEEELNKRELELNRRSFQQIFQSSPAGIFIMNDRFEITMVNDTFISLVQNTEITLEELLKDQYPKALEKIQKDDKVEDIEIAFYLGYELKHYTINISTMMEGLGNTYQGTMLDISDRVEQNERIKFLASHDMLTKVYSRNYFEEYTSNLYDEEVGIVICDIDGLKLINDAFGHLEGDRLLIQFAAHLNKSFEHDLIARLGGDEFVIVVQNTTLETLEEYEKVIKDYIDDLYMFGINIDVSIGYAMKEVQERFSEAFVVAENLMYRRKLTERKSRKSNALDTIMQTLHEKTYETEEHCQRVGDYAEVIFKLLGLERNVELEEIRLASHIHDIGKIAVPEMILNKPGKLTEEEVGVIQNHCEAGYKIISNIINNDDIATAVLYHHERWDGTGYPHQLEQEQIPLYARVISVADAFDTMISGRVYQEAKTLDESIKELEDYSGTQFDPNIIDLFVQYLKENN